MHSRLKFDLDFLLNMPGISFIRIPKYKNNLKLPQGQLLTCELYVRDIPTVDFGQILD